MLAILSISDHLSKRPRVHGCSTRKRLAETVAFTTGLMSPEPEPGIRRGFCWSMALRNVLSGQARKYIPRRQYMSAGNLALDRLAAGAAQYPFPISWLEITE